MTDIGKALELTVSRVSRIVKAGNERMARSKASMTHDPDDPETRRIFQRPLHPYTQMLQSAIPDLKMTGKETHKETQGQALPLA